jgi:predicted NAD/FAD-binding protein
MRKSILTVALTFSTILCAAGSLHEVRFKKKVDPGALQARLSVSGFKVDHINCSAEDCILFLSSSESKDPSSVIRKYVYEDPLESRKKALASVSALYEKWKAKTITNEEKDELIARSMELLVSR